MSTTNGGQETASVQANGRPKRLVICTDGTWNDPVHNQVTNVWKLARAVKRYDASGTPQIVYYHPGVGTGTDIVDRIIGGSTGFGISRNMRDVYGFIVQNYAPGDELFLFGFSRGAFTARSLAGLIRNSGILRPECGHLFTEAYELYRNRDVSTHPKSSQAIEFRTANSYGDTTVKFLGVWDTVGALGVPLGFARYGLKLWESVTGKRYLYEFHDVELSSFVKHAYHAVAIDERREAFRPTLWTSDAVRIPPDASFEQIWFPGVHCNVGGGYEAAGLSDLALTWMADRAQLHGLDLSLDILHPAVDADEHERPQNSQRWLYQLLAVLKKLNAATVRVGLDPDEVKNLDENVTWRGDYMRGVPSHDPTQMWYGAPLKARATPSSVAPLPPSLPRATAPASETATLMSPAPAKH